MERDARTDAGDQRARGGRWRPRCLFILDRSGDGTHCSPDSCKKNKNVEMNIEMSLCAGYREAQA